MSNKNYPGNESFTIMLTEQIKWLCLFFTTDRDTFEDCLRENYVIPNKSKRDRFKKCLQDRPYSKLLLKCYQPTGYHLLSSCCIASYHLL